MADSQTQPNKASVPSASLDDLAWRALVDATQGSYDVLAELARDDDNAVAFIGRRLTGGDLVVLKLEPEAPNAGGARRYTLFELKKLDDTVPAPRINCPVCAAVVAAWRGRCPACGSAIGAGVDGPVASDVLLAFYQFVSGRYDVVGELATENAGPPAYLVRGRDEPRYSMLRLALGGTVASGQHAYVVDVLPLAGPGSVTPAAPSRVPLEIATPTAVIAAATGPTTAERVCPQCGAVFGASTLFCPRDGASLRPVTSGSDIVGHLIDDRYYVEQRLGEGGMGEVYIAHQVRTGRKCALKLMHRTMTQDPDAVGRFRRETSSACAISHPNVATIFDSGETVDRRPYFAMEFVDGRSLSQVIRDEGRLDPWRTADIGRQIAEGLAAAHDLDIVHRDLKPDNVMLGTTRGGADYVKLVDFGIAKPTKGPGAGNTLTRAGFILGTPAYMSPEQLCADKVDGRTDLYSLGCVLHEMLTGATPFAGQSLEMLMMRRLTEPPPRPRTLNDDVPLVLDDIVARLLAPSPDERYPDARAAADALGAAQDTFEAPRATAGSARVRGGAAGVRTATPAPHEAGSVQVTAGNRPPRRSRDAAPPTPLSPAIPFRSPSLGGRISAETAAPPATTAGASAPRRAPMRLAAATAAVIVLAGGGFAAWRLTRSAATPRTTPAPAPTEIRSASPPVKPDTQPPVHTSEPAVGPTRRIDTARATTTVTRQPAAGAAARPSPSVVQAPVPAVAGSTAVTTPPVNTPPRDTKVAEPVPPPPVVAESKARVDPAVETERVEAGRVRESVESYVNAIGAKRLDLLRQIYPGMNESSRNGYEALFKNASDLSARLVGTPVITVHGTSAEAEFVYELTGHDPTRGNFDQRLGVRAKLQRTDERWIFLSLGAAP